MRDVLGIILSILFLFLLAVVLFCLALWARHRLLCRKERRSLQPEGVSVSVNGHAVNLVLRGSHTPPLILLASAGTCSPALDFMPLAEALKERRSTVIIEHAGAGYSEDTRLPRDVDSLVGEDRQALLAAGVLPPYILAPHSMAGLEALRWAQLHPEEIRGIVGIDIAVPQVYAHSQLSRFGVWSGRIAAGLGLSRLLPQVVEAQPQISENRLTEAQKAEYRALFYRHGLAVGPRREARAVWESAKTVMEGGDVHVPMLLLVSDGRWIAFPDGAEWRQLQRDFAEEQADRRLVELDCGHYIHQHLPGEAAARILAWIEEKPAWNGRTNERPKTASGS